MRRGAKTVNPTYVHSSEPLTEAGRDSLLRVKSWSRLDRQEDRPLPAVGDVYEPEPEFMCTIQKEEEQRQDILVT